MLSCGAEPAAVRIVCDSTASCWDPHGRCRFGEGLGGMLL